MFWLGFETIRGEEGRIIGGPKGVIPPQLTHLLPKMLIHLGDGREENQCNLWFI